MILVDSSVWIDFLRGVDTPQCARLDRLLGIERIAVGDLIAAEVLQGVLDAREFDKVRRLLIGFTQIEIGGFALALKAARNFRTLRARGVTVRKTTDTLIATRCIEDRLVLLHADRDFDPFAVHLGLLVDPASAGRAG